MKNRALAFLAGGLDWLAILKGVLLIADKVADIIRSKQLLDAGSKAEIAVQLAAIAKRVEATEQIRLAVDALSEEDLDKELSGTDPL